MNSTDSIRETADTPRSDVQDLSFLDIKAAAERSIPIHLEHPGSKEPVYVNGVPFIIRVIGYDSGAVKKVARAIADRQTERAYKRGKMVVDSEITEANRIALCVAATVGWSGVVLDNAPLEFSEQNARRLYSDPRMAWVTEQIDRAVADRQLFFTTASGS